MDWTIGICGANWSLVHSADDQAEQMANFVTDWRLVMLNDDAYNAAAHYPAEALCQSIRPIILGLGYA